MSQNLNPDDLLQQEIVKLITEFRTPETIPTAVSVHQERETNPTVRPCLVALCVNGQDRHPRYRRTTLILRARIRPAVGEQTAGAEAATVGTWHAAAVALVMEKQAELIDRLAAAGLRVRVFVKKGYGNAPEGDSGWAYDQQWQVDLESKPVG